MIANAKQVDSHTLRYEDLMSRPRRTLKAVLAWLDLPASREILDGMIAFPDQFDDSHHRTSSSAETSIGRWREELPFGQRSLIETELAEVLARFDYA
jgi:hypothetical protein